MKYYDKVMYEINKTLEELVIILISLFIGYVVGCYAVTIEKQEVENKLNEYEFNEYVIEESLNDKGYGEESE